MNILPSYFKNRHPRATARREAGGLGALAPNARSAKNKIRPFLWILAALPLAACATHSLEELRQTAPRGTPFQAELAARYLRHADEQAAAQAWEQAGHFADKGLQAAYGQNVEPDVPGENQPLLVSAHTRLLQALVHADDVPEATASAQAAFDCWLNSEQNEDLARECRESFEESLEKVTVVEKKEKVIPNKGFMVFFGLNRVKLDARAERIVEQLAEELRGLEEGYTVSLNGHADAPGSERYNLEISTKRAKAVMDALVAKGIPQSMLRVFGFGESDLRVNSKKAEAQNRRVEIYIGDGGG